MQGNPARTGSSIASLMVKSFQLQGGSFLLACVSVAVQALELTGQGVGVRIRAASLRSGTGHPIGDDVMATEPFNKPKLSINRVYTRKGDGGETRLVGGQKVSKDSLRIEAYGTIDELNSFVGAACETTREAVTTHPGLQPMIGILTRVQHELFNLGSILATLPEDVHPNQPRVTDANIAQLEGEIDSMNEDLPALTVLRASRRQQTKCRSACLSNGLPACRASLCVTGAGGICTRGSGCLSQPVK